MSEIAPLTFTAVGRPAPQGSKERTRWGMKESGAERLDPWRDSMTAAAMKALDARGGGPLWPRGAAVIIYATFFLPAPQTAVRLLERGLPAHPVSAPDADKLARALGDSCTDAGVWGDDGQADWSGIRREWAFGRPPGVDVYIQTRPGGERVLRTASGSTGLCHLVAYPAVPHNCEPALTVCGKPRVPLRPSVPLDRPCARCASVLREHRWPVSGTGSAVFLAAPILEVAG